MIIDLNLHNRLVIIVGGGKEAEKRINSLLNQNCKIIVISPVVTQLIKDLDTIRKIQVKKVKIKDTGFIARYKPDIIITTTNESKINQKIIEAAKKKRVLAYSSDNPDSSDFSNPAAIDFQNTVQIAIFTGGKSPAMSKKIKNKVQKVLKKVITKEEIGQIKIQAIARDKAKKMISSQEERKNILVKIMADKKIKQLIKEGQQKEAEKRAIALLRRKNES